MQHAAYKKLNNYNVRNYQIVNTVKLTDHRYPSKTIPCCGNYYTALRLVSLCIRGGGRINAIIPSDRLSVRPVQDNKSRTQGLKNFDFDGNNPQRI